MDFIIRKNFIKELRLRKVFNFEIKEDHDFIKQVEYKYNIKVFLNKNLYYQSGNIEPDYLNNIIPIDIEINTNTKKCQILTNKYFTQSFWMLNKKECEESDEIKEVKSILNIKNKCNNAIDLLDNYIINKFNFKIQIDDLTFDENVFLNQSNGQTNYLKTTDNIDEGYCYDINAEHPFIMSNNFFFPVRQGISKKLNDISEINLNKLGLYKVEITYRKSTQYFKSKSESKFKIVSTYYLNTLIKTKTKFIMHDSEINAIEYELKDCVNGHNLFYHDFQELYKLKKNGNKMASVFLHRIVGQMSKRVEKNIMVKTEDEFKKNQDGIYSTFAPFRLKWFIYDRCRAHMFDNYIKYAIKNNLTIYRIKADSIFLSGKIEECEIGEHMGMMKYEGTAKNVSFKHVNDKSYEQQLIK